MLFNLINTYPEFTPYIFKLRTGERTIAAVILNIKDRRKHTVGI